MVLKGRGSYRTMGKYRTGRLIVPAAVAGDSRFPLREGEVEVRVDGEFLVIRSVKK
jgi:hypothetical protein